MSCHGRAYFAAGDTCGPLWVVFVRTSLCGKYFKVFTEVCLKWLTRRLQSSHRYACIEKCYIKVIMDVRFMRISDSLESSWTSVNVVLLRLDRWNLKFIHNVDSVEG